MSQICRCGLRGCCAGRNRIQRHFWLESASEQGTGCCNRGGNLFNVCFPLKRGKKTARRLVRRGGHWLGSVREQWGTAQGLLGWSRGEQSLFWMSALLSLLRCEGCSDLPAFLPISLRASGAERLGMHPNGGGGGRTSGPHLIGAAGAEF